MSDTPANVDQTPAQPPAQPQPVAMPQALLDALKRTGTVVAEVRTYEVPEYEAIELDVLCSLATDRKGCNGESPYMVVVNMSEFPEADDFPGYIGYTRCEVVTEEGDMFAFTHYLRHADTGEMGPLADFLHNAVPPFALKVAKMGTRKGFTVYRPIPAVPRTP